MAKTNKPSTDNGGDAIDNSELRDAHREQWLKRARNDTQLIAAASVTNGMPGDAIDAALCRVGGYTVPPELQD